MTIRDWPEPWPGWCGGELAPVLPGVYAAAATSTERAVRLSALARWAPDAVLVGRTAAQLTFWPTLPGSTVECALRWPRDPQTGFAFAKRRVPPSWWSNVTASGRRAPI